MSTKVNLYHMAGLLLVTFILGACAMLSSITESKDIRDPRFSPDGKQLLFDRCIPEKFPEICRIHAYNLETSSLGYYLPPAGQTWMQANFSDAGDKLVFVTMPEQDRNRSLFSQREEVFLRTQIAVMNADGSDMRILTDNLSFKGMPAFSHSGKKIIFVQSEKLRDSGKTVAAYWDLWELDMETNKQELFAGKNGFYRMNLPKYFQDDQHVLLNGDAPMLSPLIKDGSESFSVRMGSYESRYKNNTVFKVKRGEALSPPLFTEFSNTEAGCLDGQGNIYLSAASFNSGLRIRRIEIDGKQSDWKYPPIQSNKFSFLGMNASRDGRFIALSIEDGSISRLMLLDTVSGSWRELVLPDEATPINRQ